MEYKLGYEQMPSADCKLDSRFNISRRYMRYLDMSKVNEICDKYGVKLIEINSTFGGDGVNLLFTIKLDVSVLEYKSDTYKIYSENYPLIKKMEDCVNELDCNTNLYFDTNYTHYVGCVPTLEYAYIRIMTSVDIKRYWDLSIHDTNRKISDGVYIIADTNLFKQCPIPNFEDLTKGFEDDTETIGTIMQNMIKVPSEYDKSGKYYQFETAYDFKRCLTQMGIDFVLTDTSKTWKDMIFDFEKWGYFACDDYTFLKQISITNMGNIKENCVMIEFDNLYSGGYVNIGRLINGDTYNKEDRKRCYIVGMTEDDIKKLGKVLYGIKNMQKKVA